MERLRVAQKGYSAAGRSMLLCSPGTWLWFPIKPWAAASGIAALFAADAWISKQVPDRPNQLSRSKTISDYSLYSLIGTGGGAYIFGKLSNNDHMAETGLLAAEAAIDATGVTYALKFATARQRPFFGTGDGELFSGHFGSTNLSFPSEHSAIAWSIAGVIAHEYP